MLPAGTAFAATAVLRGSVIYRERMALPPGAIVEVKLADVSLADAPAQIIAETRFRARSGPPIRYSLRYDRARIRPRRRYALQARILIEDQLLFINTDHHAVFAGGRDETTILVRRAGGEAPPPAAASPAGRWLAEDIRGGGVIDRLQTVLEIGPDGAVSGSGGCNRIIGRAAIDGNSISFGRVAATQMACAPAAMNQERKFLDALGDVRSWRVDPMRRKLILLDGGRAPILILARM